MTSEALEISAVALPLAIDVVATFVFSITGAMVAIQRNYDPVGLFVLALASGLGGGLLRDGLFIQSGPPAAMQDGSYLIAVVAGCVVAGLFFRHVERLSKAFLVLDALGTGAYGIVGSSKAFEAGLAVPACIVVGVINATGGGLVRDVLVREEPLMLKPGQFYIIASLMGVGAFAALRLYAHLPLIWAAGAGIGVTFALRLLAITFNWKTRPVRRAPPG
jgi:uncharacterized membrane protein YeiH